MKLLFAIAEMGVGGAETMVEDLAIAALERGDEVALVSAGGFRAERLVAHGASVYQAPLAGRRPADLARAVTVARRAARRFRPDVVHVHNVKAALVLRLATLGRRVPTVVTMHGVPETEYDSAARVLRHAAELVIAVSAHLADELIARGQPVDRIRVIENAVHVPATHDRAAVRRDLLLDTDAPVAVMIARLVDQKRHDLAIDAWSSVPDAILLIVGDGPNRAAIQQQVTATGQDGRIRLLGARTDVDRLLAAADLSVLATNWEGLPISVLEAMAAGVPVVASAVSGLTETLDSAALLVEPGSAAAFADGVRAVLADSALRARLSAAGRELIDRRFGAPRMLSAYRDAYVEIARATS